MEENKTTRQLGKKEQWEFKQQEKRNLKMTSESKKQFKKWSLRTVGIILVLGILISLVWYIANRPPIPQDEIISRNGLHWHANIEIYVNGVKQNIPTDIGIGAVHMPIHTHSADGIVHMEMSGLVKRNDLTLGRFFKNWDKDLRSFGDKMIMTVNGEDNIEFENYIMRDNDKIEIRYE